MKFIIDDKIPFIRGRVEAAGAEAEYVAPGLITREKALGADALVVRTRTRIDRSLLEGTGVRFVATATIGTDHIDLEWCRANGVEVANAAGCNAPGVAQYVWSSLLRQGFDPSRHTLGVVGKGHVGGIVAAWGRLMGCRVLVCDPPRAESGLNDEDYKPLREVLAEADAVTLHTPLTHNGSHPTFHLLGEGELELLKPGSILVNSARGPVVDNAAWAARLAGGGVRAVVDTWEGEPAVSGALLELASYATPHIAGYSRQGKERATRMALEAAGRHFGLRFPTEGLEGEYAVPRTLGDNAAEAVRSSYAPEKDTEKLRNNPEKFEALRSSYDFRDEPVFN